MKSEQIKHSLSIGTKSIQSRVFDRETDEVISFVKIPIEDSGLVRCEKGAREMNNEPVAYVDNVWINRPDLAMDLGIGQMFSRCQLSDHQIPLYTHPVKEQDCYGDGNVHRGIRSKDSEVQTIYFNPVKEQLTDEEIKSCWNWETDCQEWAIEFARAIEAKVKQKNS